MNARRERVTACDFKLDAMLNWFLDIHRYLSLKDIKTLCKSFAYIKDMIHD